MKVSENVNFYTVFQEFELILILNTVLLLVLKTVHQMSQK